MAIPDSIKTNFHTLGKAFEKGDIALLECRDRSTGEPEYAICAINIRRQADCEPEIVMVPFGLMFNSDPYEMLLPPTDPEFDKHEMEAGGGERRRERR